MLGTIQQCCCSPIAAHDTPSYAPAKCVTCSGAWSLTPPTEGAQGTSPPFPYTTDRCHPLLCTGYGTTTMHTQLRSRAPPKPQRPTTKHRNTTPMFPPPTNSTITPRFRLTTTHHPPPTTTATTNKRKASHHNHERTSPINTASTRCHMIIDFHPPLTATCWATSPSFYS